MTSVDTGVGDTEDAGGHSGDAAGQIISSLPGVFYLFRADDGRMLRWNGELERRTGCSAETIARCHPLDLLSPADHDIATATIREVVDRGWSDCEIGLLGPDSVPIPHYFCGHRVEIDGSICVSGLGVDLSALRAAREDADRMRERLVDAIEANPDGFAYYDADDCLQVCNSRYRELMGPAASMPEPGQRFRAILEVGLRAGIYADAQGRESEWLLERLSRRREHAHDCFEQRLSTGQWLRVEEHPTRDGGRVSILVDITAYKEREARLRESEQRYRALFDSDADAIIISDVESGRLLDANHRAEVMFGHDRLTMLGLTRSDLHPEATRTRAEAAYTARCQQANAIPFRQQALRADGTTVPVEISATVVVDEVRGRRLIQAVIRDVTQRELVEQMNADRARILESIARRAPLAEVLRQVRMMLEHLGATRGARVLVARDHSLIDVDGVGGLVVDARLLSATNVGDSDDERVPLPPAAAAEIAPEDGGGEPVLEVLRDREGNVVGALAMILPDDMPQAPHPAASALVEAAGLAAIAIEQQNLADRLAWQAGHDELTELPNRALLMDRLQQAVARARRRHIETSLMLLDLDDFKRVNDTLGHGIGDQVLQVVAQRLADCLREEDTVARLGGDEFVLVLPATGPDEAGTVADKIVEVLAQPVELQGRSLVMTPSIGISVHPHDCTSPETLLQHADSAMYAAKHAGKGRYCFYGAAA